MIDESITYLVKGLHLMVQSYWGALFFLLVGVLLLRYSIKKPTTIFNLRGWAGGVALNSRRIINIVFQINRKDIIT